ncbi:MAG: glycine C-acetyltransferase [Petroclostridium sp.]|jgi:glycine C-acetyltransferase|uniref:aminotransferase class I/II-fold pyridoxal phosphate-dependent enzyme n=1 Tax=Petroclostridium xylanilyticum TaxID=1792311 RepID=UPI000B98FCC0|nr:aminotransferase class I/II-fold pyridoxal phosphate-dependent enzyme [Petroclostridium xylanilyticum]MBZ4647174.1 Glycine C-acetyltransferase [Clostridia bacterium]MDK2810463.1 glycine C-acetyltransferase [Petroclostridium sp.]
MDSTKYSLADFYDISDMDMVDRARYFYEYHQDIHKKHHNQYRRVSLNGSGPTMKILDPYSGIEKEMIYMASNDYLNLTRHPRTIKAGRAALEKYGTGAGSVPLLGGTLDIHIELEKRVAAFKGCEAAIVYTSGFGSNCGSIAALLRENDVAILDMLVHASIIDGCKGTHVEYFRHNNMDSLEKVLRKCKDKFRTKLVIVDGVYSMDGDISKLDTIVELAHSHGAYVMVDEAHATGVIGKNGRGTPEHFNIEGKVDIVAGTFSKALGVVGGFIASSKEIVEYLHYYSRPYMFSTAQTPQTAASLIEAMNVIEDEPQLKENLWKNINYFKKSLIELGFNIGNSETAIFPVIVGHDVKVREMCREMHEAGIYVNAVQYPAVSRKLSRIRMSLMCNHTKQHLDRVLEVLEHLGRKYEIINKPAAEEVEIA